MNAISFSLILAGVLLNAAAQLLLKAGTNAVGHFEFHADNILPVGLTLAVHPYILSGMLFYSVSLVVWSNSRFRLPVSLS